MSVPHHLPIAVIGAGASGLMAAIWAVGRGRRVVLVEGTSDGGRKILVSGGGRCNILPSVAAPERFVTDSPAPLLRKLHRSWPLREQRTFFEEEAGLPLVLEEETGKLFPETNSARQVRDALVALARVKGAECRFGARVVSLEPPGSDGAWRLRLEDGSELLASAVVLATGGRSVPETGSDGWGLELLARLGHTLHPSYPALTALTAEPAVHAHLAGISLVVTLEATGPGKKTTSRGGFLFTHRGYSGPVVLDLSHLAVRSRLAGGQRQPLFVKWTDDDAEAWDRRLQRFPAGVGAAVAREMPARLAEALCLEAGVEPRRSAAQLRREDRLNLVRLLTRYPLPWTGDEGYAKAEVTGGGVDLCEVEPRTMESRRHPGLFLCGELLDAWGPIGGHNFQWAWATGRAAGLGAAARAGEAP